MDDHKEFDEVEQEVRIEKVDVQGAGMEDEKAAGDKENADYLDDFEQDNLFDPSNHQDALLEWNHNVLMGEADVHYNDGLDQFNAFMDEILNNNNANIFNKEDDNDDKVVIGYQDDDDHNGDESPMLDRKELMNQPDEEDVCRVCRSQSLPDQPLYHPCKCSGSMRYVHQSCLEEWLQHSQQKKCEICGFEFSFSPLFSPDMPQTFSLLLLIKVLLKKAFGLLLKGIRITCVICAWLLVIPFITAVFWRFSLQNDVPLFPNISGIIPQSYSFFLKFGIVPNILNLIFDSKSESKILSSMNLDKENITISYNAGNTTTTELEQIEAVIELFSFIGGGLFLMLSVVLFALFLILIREQIMMNANQFIIEEELEQIPQQRNEVPNFDREQNLLNEQARLFLPIQQENNPENVTPLNHIIFDDKNKDFEQLIDLIDRNIPTITPEAIRSLETILIGEDSTDLFKDIPTPFNLSLLPNLTAIISHIKAYNTDNYKDGDNELYRKIKEIRDNRKTHSFPVSNNQSLINYSAGAILSFLKLTNKDLAYLALSDHRSISMFTTFLDSSIRQLLGLYKVNPTALLKSQPVDTEYPLLNELRKRRNLLFTVTLSDIKVENDCNIYDLGEAYLKAFGPIIDSPEHLFRNYDIPEYDAEPFDVLLKSLLEDNKAYWRYTQYRLPDHHGLKVKDTFGTKLFSLDKLVEENQSIADFVYYLSKLGTLKKSESCELLNLAILTELDPIYSSYGAFDVSDIDVLELYKIPHPDILTRSLLSNLTNEERYDLTNHQKNEMEICKVHRIGEILSSSKTLLGPLTLYEKYPIISFLSHENIYHKNGYWKRFFSRFNSTNIPDPYLKRLPIHTMDIRRLQIRSNNLPPFLFDIKIFVSGFVDDKATLNNTTPWCPPGYTIDEEDEEGQEEQVNEQLMNLHNRERILLPNADIIEEIQPLPQVNINNNFDNLNNFANNNRRIDQNVEGNLPVANAIPPIPINPPIERRLPNIQVVEDGGQAADDAPVDLRNDLNLVLEFVGINGTFESFLQNALIATICIDAAITVGAVIPHYLGIVACDIFMLIFILPATRLFTRFISKPLDKWLDKIANFIVNTLKSFRVIKEKSTDNEKSQEIKSIYVPKDSKIIKSINMDNKTLDIFDSYFDKSIDSVISSSKEFFYFFSLFGFRDAYNIASSISNFGNKSNITSRYSLPSNTLNITLNGATDAKLSTTESPTIIDAIVRLEDNTTLMILIGYVIIVFAISGYARLSGLTKNPYFKSFRILISGLVNKILTTAKFLFIIFTELWIFPTFCGILIDVTTFPIFGASSTLASRINFHHSFPWASRILHLLVGTGFMFLTAIYVSILRKVTRPGVIWFSKDPNDPELNIIQELLDAPMTTHIRKLIIGFTIYTMMLVSTVCGTIYSIKLFDYIFTQNNGGSLQIFPLKWDFSTTLVDFPIDLIFFHIVVPWLIVVFKPKRLIRKAIDLWMHKGARLLRISHFMFGERRLDEESESEEELNLEPSRINDNIEEENIDINNAEIGEVEQVPEIVDEEVVEREKEIVIKDFEDNEISGIPSISNRLDIDDSEIKVETIEDVKISEIEKDDVEADDEFDDDQENDTETKPLLDKGNEPEFTELTAPIQLSDDAEEIELELDSEGEESFSDRDFNELLPYTPGIKRRRKYRYARVPKKDSINVIVGRRIIIPISADEPVFGYENENSTDISLNWTKVYAPPSLRKRLYGIIVYQQICLALFIAYVVAVPLYIGRYVTTSLYFNGHIGIDTMPLLIKPGFENSTIQYNNTYMDHLHSVNSTLYELTKVNLTTVQSLTVKDNEMSLDRDSTLYRVITEKVHNYHKFRKRPEILSNFTISSLYAQVEYGKDGKLLDVHLKRKLSNQKEIYVDYPEQFKYVSKIRPDIPIHDIYSYAIGSIILLCLTSAFKWCMKFRRYLKRSFHKRKSLLKVILRLMDANSRRRWKRRAKYLSLTYLNLSFIFFFIGLTLPLMIGYSVEFYIIRLLNLPHNRATEVGVKLIQILPTSSDVQEANFIKWISIPASPNHILWNNWALGLVLIKICHTYIMAGPESEFKRVLRLVGENHFDNIPIASLWKVFVKPALLLFSGLLFIPYILSHISNFIVHYNHQIEKFLLSSKNGTSSSIVKDNETTYFTSIIKQIASLPAGNEMISILLFIIQILEDPIVIWTVAIITLLSLLPKELFSKVSGSLKGFLEDEFVVGWTLHNHEVQEQEQELDNENNNNNNQEDNYNGNVENNHNNDNEDEPEEEEEED